MTQTKSDPYQDGNNHLHDEAIADTNMREDRATHPACDQDGSDEGRAWNQKEQRDDDFDDAERFDLRRIDSKMIEAIEHLLRRHHFVKAAEQQE